MIAWSDIRSTLARNFAARRAEAAVIAKKARQDNIDVLSPGLALIGRLRKKGQPFKPEGSRFCARVHLAGDPSSVTLSRKLEGLGAINDFELHRPLVAGHRWS